MTSTDSLPDGQPAAAGALRRLAGRIRTALDECRYAQRRMLELNTAQDRYLFRSEQAPETYAEFLLRTNGVLRREPSAADRAPAERRGRRHPRSAAGQ